MAGRHKSVQRRIVNIALIAGASLIASVLAPSQAHARASMPLTAVLAQANNAPRPPLPKDPGKAPLILYYGVAFVLAGATIAAAVFPSKRDPGD